MSTLRECGWSGVFEVINRLLSSTADHQHTSGFDSGRLHGHADAEIAVRNALKELR